MYRELIGTFTANHNWAGLQSPCSDRELAEAEAFVGFSFPEDLKGLLRETNGVFVLLTFIQPTVSLFLDKSSSKFTLIRGSFIKSQ